MFKRKQKLLFWKLFIMFYYVTESTDAPIFIGSNILTYSPGQLHNRRFFPVFNLIVVQQGQMTLVEDNIEYVIPAGSYFIQEPFKLHYGVKPTQKILTFSFVHFMLPDGWKRIEDDSKETLYTQVEHGRFLQPDKYRLCIPKYGTCSNTTLQTAYELSLGLRQCYSPLQSKGLFYKLFHEILQDAKLLNQSISTHDIKSFVDHYYMEKDFSLDWLCKKMHYTRQYITKILKMQTGMNFREYVGFLKIEHAKTLLATHNTTVQNIALLLGYSDAPAFCHHFQKKTGLTPSEYQKRTSMHSVD